MTKQNEIRRRIREVMHEYNLTQSRLGKDCGFSSQYISSVLNGKKPVSDNLIERISYRYGVDEKWLLVGVGEMMPKEPEKEDEDMNKALGEFLAFLIGKDDKDALKRAVFYLSKLTK